MSIGIVYYSRNNTTKKAAEILSKSLNAKLIELTETKGRNNIFGFVKSGYQAATKKSSQLLGEPWNQVKEYDTLYLMTPIWATSGITPAMNSFLENVDLTNKKVNIITFQADPNFSGSEKAHDYITKCVENNNGTVVKCFALHGAKPGSYAGEEHIQKQIQNIN